MHTFLPLSKTQKYLGIAVLLSCCVILGYIGYKTWNTTREGNDTLATLREARAKLLAFKESDIVINPGHEISVVIYEDTDCPICKNLETIIDSLIQRGAPISVVYRYHLLPIYPKSFQEALFLECVKNNRPDVYRNFKTSLFSVSSSENYDEERLFELATPYINRDILQACIQDPSTTAAIEASQTESAALGVQRVPHGFIYGEDSSVYEFLGARPQEFLLGLIEKAGTSPARP